MAIPVSGVSRTIADLADKPDIQPEHLAEAIVQIKAG